MQGSPLPRVRGAQPRVLRDDAVGEAGYVVGHYQEIARAAAAVFDPIGQDGFDLEAEVLEGGARRGLLGGHLGR